MSIINTAFLTLSKTRLNQIDFFKANPHQVQEELLSNLIKAARTTRWGAKHSYGTIDNIPEYQLRVPIQEYSAIQPYIDRMRQGENNVLWSTPVRWFAKSSGTTAAKSKFIPVSNESLQGCHYRGAKDLLITYINNNPTSKIMTGKSLTLGGSHQLDESGSGIKYGDLSAILIQNTPFYAELVREPNRTTALMPDFENKLKEISKQVIDKDIISFSGVPSWNLVMMKHILDYSGKQNLLELWPNLEVFFHGGIAFAPYREQYKRIIPNDKMRYMETYNASEGFFALQDDPNDSGMLLLLDIGIFYEFVPLSELGKPRPKALTISEVQLGVNYAMVITTNGGLWRYLIGDTIMFTSTFPHKIKITGRTRHYINAFGEELIIDNAEMALFHACEQTGAIVTEYTVAPIYMGDEAKGAHEWLIEFETLPDNLEDFANKLDAELCKVNSDYEAKRAKSVTLNRLKLEVMPNGVFYEWMNSRGKLGGQNKVPRLYNTREYVDSLKEIAQKLG